MIDVVYGVTNWIFVEYPGISLWLVLSILTIVLLWKNGKPKAFKGWLVLVALIIAALILLWSGPHYFWSGIKAIMLELLN